jgi:hypothetical protein
MIRRRFLGGLAATAALAPRLPAAAAAPRLIDSNVWLGHPPGHRTTDGTAATLRHHLAARGVTSAWVGDFAGVLTSDLAGANARLATACATDGAGLLVPFGTINPTLPDWEEDLRRCHEIHRMPGVRLLPGYHGYAVDDPRFARLLALATERDLLVQIALVLEDERTQNPALVAPPVVAAPLAPLVEANHRARVMLLNATSRLFAATPLLRRLAAAGVLCELATLEGAAGIATVLKAAPQLALAFGSYSPFFTFESARLKLQESELTSAQFSAITSGHAEAALRPRP